MEPGLGRKRGTWWNGDDRPAKWSRWRPRKLMTVEKRDRSAERKGWIRETEPTTPRASRGWKETGRGVAGGGEKRKEEPHVSRVLGAIPSRRTHPRQPEYYGHSEPFFPR